MDRSDLYVEKCLYYGWSEPVELGSSLLLWKPVIMWKMPEGNTMTVTKLNVRFWLLCILSIKHGTWVNVLIPRTYTRVCTILLTCCTVVATCPEVSTRAKTQVTS